jgi:pimeloyl-ACP methyl ester carboxylesterase
LRLELRGGRHLAWQVYGRRDGRPIFFFHGFPGCSAQAAIVHAQAAAADVALIAFDRPGFGRSDPARLTTVDSVIGDVAALADHLGHERFATIGVSCGGPYALGSARLLPGRVTAVGLLAGAGPMNRPEARQGQLPILTTMFRLARVHPWLVSPLLALDWVLFRASAERAVKALAALLSEPDRALLARDETVRTRFGASLAEAYRQGIGGAMREAQRIAHLTVEGLERIEVPVHVFQGGHDRHVPPAMGRFLAQALPNGHFHWCPDEGHTSIVVNQFDACVRRLAAVS